MSALSIPNIKKRDNLDIFTKKWKAKDPFQLLNGKKIILEYTKGEETRFRETIKSGGKFAFRGPKNELIKLSDILKTSEFGGKPVAGEKIAKISGAKVHGYLIKVKKEFDPSYKLNIPSPTERGELQVLQIINSFFAQIQHPITMKIGRHTLYNIVGANKIEGTPKADISLVQLDPKTKKLKDVFFISHKMGNSAGDFQQYSGTTEQADARSVGSITKDKTVLKFLKSITSRYNSIVNDKKRYYHIIDDDDLLIRKAVYGPDVQSPIFTVNNIQMIAQGLPKIHQLSDDIYTLNFSSGSEFNPDVRKFKQGDYIAVLAARFSEGRQFTFEGKNYRNVRVLIMPKKVIGGQAIEI